MLSAVNHWDRAPGCILPSVYRVKCLPAAQNLRRAETRPRGVAGLLLLRVVPVLRLITLPVKG
jgi:hypothetical protein